MLALGACACLAGPGGAAAQDEPVEDAAGTDASGDGSAEATSEGGDQAEPEQAEPVPPEPPPFSQPTLDPARLAQALAAGERVFNNNCAPCHGRRGDGRGPAARFLRIRPRNFTTGAYKYRTTPSGALPTDADILRTVRRGIPGTEMPRWAGRLPDSDLRAVVQYIKTFSPRFATEEMQAAIPMPTTTPRFDASSVQRGRMLYVLMRCWTCHGATGRGDGAAVATMVDDEHLPIVPQNFTRGEWRSGGRPLDVFRTFTTGINGTPMPSFDEALLVGRDAFTNLDSYVSVTTAEERAGLREFLSRLPTTEEIWGLGEDERRAGGTQLRWDLVAYVMALPSGAAIHWLTGNPYATR